MKPVETLEQALAQRGALDDGESLISRDGYWVGRHFLRVRRSDEAQGGMLARAQELEALQERRESLETRVAEGEERLAAARDEQRELEGAREQVRRQVQEEGRRHGELKAQLSAQQAKVEQLVLRRRRLDEEVAELAEQRALEQEQLSEARLTLQEALDSMALDTERRETLLAERDALRERLDRIRQDARTHSDHAHQLAVRVGSLRAQHNSTQQALERLDQQSARLNERCEQLNLNLEEAAPLEELRMKLEELLERRMAVEDELKQARLALKTPIANCARWRSAAARPSSNRNCCVASWSSSAWSGRGWWCGARPCRSSSPKTATTCTRYWPTCPWMPANANGRSVSRAAARIQRLGPINLAAIEEYQQQSERKRYLDSQNDDLAEALETLENVIRKIDRKPAIASRKPSTRSMLAFRHCSRRYSAAVRHIWNLPAKIYSIPVWRSWRACRARRTAPSTCCPAGKRR